MLLFAFYFVSLAYIKIVRGFNLVICHGCDYDLKQRFTTMEFNTGNANISEL